MSCNIPVTLSNNIRPVAESSLAATGCVAMAGNSKIDPIDEAQRVAELSAGYSIGHRSATLIHPTPIDDNTPTVFENSVEELEYLRHEDAYSER